MAAAQIKYLGCWCGDGEMSISREREIGQSCLPCSWKRRRKTPTTCFSVLIDRLKSTPSKHTQAISNNTQIAMEQMIAHNQGKMRNVNIFYWSDHIFSSITRTAVDIVLQAGGVVTVTVSLATKEPTWTCTQSIIEHVAGDWWFCTYWPEFYSSTRLCWSQFSGVKLTMYIFIYRNVTENCHGASL